MRISDLPTVRYAKALPFIAVVWLCAGTALALDASPSDRGGGKNRDPRSDYRASSPSSSPASSSGSVSPAEAQQPAARDEDEQVTVDETPIGEANAPVTKDAGQSVLDVAGAPLKAIGNVVDATRDAIRSYLAGNKQEAFKSLSYAADQGHAPAQWKLARMYAEGDGVPRDDVRAFENFSLMCDRHADEAPGSPTAPFIASAFNALGSYYLNGIPNSAVKANPVRAREMFAYSASYFGDPEAQFILAKLYIDGVGGTKDSRQALRWLNLSAEKGHRLAQAELGQLLFSGEAGPKQRARGLMWLRMASENADPATEVWIIDANKSALEEASDMDRLAANAYWLQHSRQKK